MIDKIDKLIPWIIGILIAACLGLVGAIIYAEHQLLQPVKGEVIELWMDPAHTTVQMIMSGKVMVPVIINHPDRWFVSVKDKKDGQIKTRAVFRSVYETLRIGKYVELYQEDKLDVKNE
jgi:hypothetical protein